MTDTAAHVLEEYRRLAPAEKREVLDAIVRGTAERSTAAGQPHQTLEDVLGKFRPLSCDDLKNHDLWFAEAILASKNPPEAG